MSDETRERNAAGAAPELRVVRKAQGEIEALPMKAALEAAGIPVFLKSDAAGILYGITVDGLGEVKIMVPADRLEEARAVLETVVEPLAEEGGP